MKKFHIPILAVLTVAAFVGQLRAQTNESVSTNAPIATTTNAPGVSTNALPVTTNVPAVAEPHTNAAIVPAKHAGTRTDLVMQRAKDAPGRYDIAFIGDSITAGWERAGT